jgi:hypothetical protein
MVEAPTGVGKSFAYLVPAIQAAAANKECRVVISTHAIGLQEQLVRKDIPFLHCVMPQRFQAEGRNSPPARGARRTPRAVHGPRVTPVQV